MFRWGDDKFSHLGYRLFTFFYSERFDCYLFHYREGSYIPRHKDPSYGKRHYRFNIVLKKPKEGGDFICKKTILSLFNGRIMLFRADNSYHQITPITKGTRWLLSFGVRL